MEASEYWIIAVEEALGGQSIDASTEQIAAIAKDMESAREMELELTGADIASHNYNSYQARKIKALEDEVEKERRKVPCEHCKGGTAKVVGIGGVLMRADCWRCNTTGRVDG